MILQTTLPLAAAAAVINIWLVVRCMRLRLARNILHGDGGDGQLGRCMRAHANFIEHAPIALILIALIDLAGRGGSWLAYAGGAFMLARVAHAFGMTADKPTVARAGGILVTLVVEAGLAVVAVLIALGRF